MSAFISVAIIAIVDLVGGELQSMYTDISRNLANAGQ
jgi:Flp pilus assembly pilin Flp